MKFLIFSLLYLVACAGAETVKLKINKDIPYFSSGSDNLQKLDIYYPAKSDSKSKVLIHIHGGGWRIGDKKSTSAHGKYFASQGIVFVTLNYRLSPQVKHPAHIEDCAAGVKWVMDNLENLNGDKDKIYLSGHSAGAQLAALLATKPKYLAKYGLKPSIFNTVIPVDTASYDFLKTDKNSMVGKMVKSAFGENEVALKGASPYHQLIKGEEYPSFHIFVTARRADAVMASKAFSDRINLVGGKSEISIIKGHTHRDMNIGMYKEGDPLNKILMTIFK